uniref:Uncharacterized protein n=1 Tax=Arundo donax TaxID=35708 RepID=A0A0A9HDF4_ARUDO
MQLMGHCSVCFHQGLILLVQMLGDFS